MSNWFNNAKKTVPRTSLSLCSTLSLFLLLLSSVVRAFAHGAMGRRIDPSWRGTIELFLVPASAPRLVQQRPWYVLSCLWDGAYKRIIVVNRKE